MDLHGYRDYVRAFFDLDDDDLPDRLLDRWANEGFVRIARRCKQWRHYETVVSLQTENGVAEYELVGVAEVRSVDGPDGPLRFTDDTEARRRHRADTQPAAPSSFSVFAGKLRLWPTPDAEYTLTVAGYRPPAEWLAGGSAAEPDLPEDFHDLLLSWVMHRAYLHQEDVDGAAVEKAQFDEGLATLLRDDQQATPYSPIVLNSERSTPVHPVGRLRYPWE